ncbi:MAG: hydrogenase maturation nickel metallochaperone HypA [Nitrospiraceae bacterium]|jgi:hydrogenase nickel incorporation protein HypA/HybF|nr:hydrogenase maturation nickel metallochaperone HypA [Nitrospiraceae bacterium]
MHEVAIAESLLNVAIDNCTKSGHARITGIQVLIGKASGVMPEALLFAFDSMKPDTIAQDAVLEIIEVPLGGHCSSCRRDFEVEERYVLACPHCGGVQYSLVKGRELSISEMEVE